MDADEGETLRPGDRVRVPWEFRELEGTVAGVSTELNRATVAIDIDGSREEFSFPLSAVVKLGASPEGAEAWAGGVEDDTVLRAVLEAVGHDHAVSVAITPTTGESGQAHIILEVLLTDPADIDIDIDELLRMQADVREAVFQALDERAIVIAQVLPSEKVAA